MISTKPLSVENHEPIKEIFPNKTLVESQLILNWNKRILSTYLFELLPTTEHRSSCGVASPTNPVAEPPSRILKPYAGLSVGSPYYSSQSPPRRRMQEFFLVSARFLASRSARGELATFHNKETRLPRTTGHPSSTHIHSVAGACSAILVKRASVAPLYGLQIDHPKFTPKTIDVAQTVRVTHHLHASFTTNLRFHSVMHRWVHVQRGEQAFFTILIVSR